MNLLALDCATRLGWASGSTAAGPPAVGHIDLPPPVDGARGPTFFAFRREVEKMILVGEIDRVIMEAAILPKPFIKSAPGKRPLLVQPTSVQVTALLHGMLGVLEELCCAHAVPLSEVNPQEAKKMLAGDGGADKDKMLRAAQRLYPDMRDHNEADALAIWLCGVYHYDRLALEKFEKKLWGRLV
jgi:hypothetical protein